MRLFVPLLLLALAARTSAGQPPRASTTAAAAPSASPDPARDHYERGLAKYNLADFDAAIVEFKQSYEISKAPRLLFNIAQAYRLKKDYESALFFYNTYLRTEPNAPNKDDVESKIFEMRRAIEEHGQAPTLPPKPPSEPARIPPPPPSGPSPTEVRAARRRYLVSGLGTAGAGLLVAGAGAGLLALAVRDANTLHNLAATGMATWSAANDAIYREGDRSQTAGVVLLAVGAAAFAAGGVVAILGLRMKPR
jgi:tetratricopeptide (TPR) repeat protein